MATKVPFCEPCLRGDNQMEGLSWCAECEETLCNSCDKAHRVGKLSLSHNLIELKELPEIPKETLDDVDKCKIHETKAFCTYHDALCCRQCLISDHRTCDKIEYLDDIIGMAKSSAVVDEMPLVFENLKQIFDKITENRKMNRSHVENKTEQVKDAVAKFKDLLLQNIDLLEKSLITEVDELQQSAFLSFDNDEKEVSNLKTKLQLLEQEFQFNLKFGSNRKFFCFLHQLKQNISENDKYVQDKLSTMQDINIKFTSDQYFEATISNIAEIEQENNLTSIAYNPAAGLNAQSSPPLLEFSPNPTDNIDMAKQHARAITGIEIAKNGDLLLCSFYGEKVLKYTTEGTFIQMCAISGQPHGIAFNKGQETATVTVPYYKSKILFIDVQTLSIKKSIKKEHRYFGISAIGDKFLIASENKFIDEIGQDGAHIRRINVPSAGAVRYISIRQDGSMLYANTSYLVCFDAKVNSVLFEYQNTIEARGIAIDKNGCIYIAEKSGKCISRLSANGQFLDKTLLQDSPLALKFDSDCTKLYVGLETKSKVVVFSIK